MDHGQFADLFIFSLEIFERAYENKKALTICWPLAQEEVG